MAQFVPLSGRCLDHPSRCRALLSRLEGLALLASLSLAGALGPDPASAAVIVSVNGRLWSVDAITAALNDPGFESTINTDTMPWLGQPLLAGQFAEAVGVDLGLGNVYSGLDFGPVYFWKTSYRAGVPQSPGDWGVSVFNPYNTSPPPNPLAGVGPVIPFDGPLDPADLSLRARIAVAPPISPLCPLPAPCPWWVRWRHGNGAGGCAGVWKRAVRKGRAAKP